MLHVALFSGFSLESLSKAKRTCLGHEWCVRGIHTRIKVLPSHTGAEPGSFAADSWALLVLAVHEWFVLKGTQKGRLLIKVF